MVRTPLCNRPIEAAPASSPFHLVRWERMTGMTRPELERSPTSRNVTMGWPAMVGGAITRQSHNRDASVEFHQFDTFALESGMFVL